MIESKVVEILLVEDSPEDLELALRALQKSRLANHIHVARDGEEALNFLFGSTPSGQKVEPLRPRLVLLDLNLPKVDGIEVLQQLKNNPDTKNIPDCYKLGVNSYIVKPVNFEQFYEAVHQLGMYWLLLNESLR
jgi:two-component system, response regulator